MTERLVLMVVLCDLEKVVRTDAAKEERKIAEDEKVVRTDAAKEERKIAEDIYVNVCLNKILCDVFAPSAVFFSSFFLPLL